MTITIKETGTKKPHNLRPTDEVVVIRRGGIDPHHPMDEAIVNPRDILARLPAERWGEKKIPPGANAYEVFTVGIPCISIGGKLVPFFVPKERSTQVERATKCIYCGVNDALPGSVSCGCEETPDDMRPNTPNHPGLRRCPKCGDFPHNCTCR